MIDLAKAAFREMVNLSDGERKALLKDVTRIESAAGIAGTLGLAGSLRPCAIAAPLLDADPFLLNTASGVVDLRTGLVRSALPADYLSKVTRARFDSDARSDEFETFLERIQPEQAMRDYLARSLGAALLGLVREHVLNIWHGDGANGKTTLRDVVQHALGDYCVSVPPDILLVNRHGQQQNAPERMRLRGARLAFCSEIGAGARLDEATMKALVGGDPVTARLLYRNPIEFDPEPPADHADEPPAEGAGR